MTCDFRRVTLLLIKEEILRKIFQTIGGRSDHWTVKSEWDPRLG